MGGWQGGAWPDPRGAGGGVREEAPDLTLGIKGGDGEMGRFTWAQV